jgi:hypothetical protein
VSGGGGASLDEGNNEVEETTTTAVTTGFLPGLRRRGLSPRGFRSKAGHGFPSRLANARSPGFRAAGAETPGFGHTCGEWRSQTSPKIGKPRHGLVWRAPGQRDCRIRIELIVYVILNASSQQLANLLRVQKRGGLGFGARLRVAVAHLPVRISFPDMRFKKGSASSSSGRCHGFHISLPRDVSLFVCC